MHQGQAPSDAAVYELTEATGLVDLLSAAGMVKSKSEGRRLVQQGGVRIDGDPIKDIGYIVEPYAEGEKVLQAGKRRFVRLTS